MTTLTADVAGTTTLSEHRSVRAAVDDARFAMVALQLEFSPASAAERHEAAEVDCALASCAVGADFVSWTSGTVAVDPSKHAAAVVVSAVVDALDAGHCVEVDIDHVTSDVARLALRRMSSVLPAGRLLLLDDAD